MGTVPQAGPCSTYEIEHCAGKKCAVELTPMQPLQLAVEKALTALALPKQPSDCKLLHNGRQLDLSLPLCFAGLPQNAALVLDAGTGTLQLSRVGCQVLSAYSQDALLHRIRPVTWPGRSRAVQRAVCRLISPRGTTRSQLKSRTGTRKQHCTPCSCSCSCSAPTRTARTHSSAGCHARASQAAAWCSWPCSRSSFPFQHSSTGSCSSQHQCPPPGG